VKIHHSDAQWADAQWVLPQQPPGTHPCVAGFDPQQPVSFGPAMAPVFLNPEALELAERSFCISPLPHREQCTASEAEKMSASEMFPHFEHRYSWIGIYGDSII